MKIVKTKMRFQVEKSLKVALSKFERSLFTFPTILSLFTSRTFDVNQKNKVDISRLLQIKPENGTLKEMQHSKWATSNNLFDYNSFINDFYALIEEYNSYKNRDLSSERSQTEFLSSLKGSFFFNGGK